MLIDLLHFLLQFWLKMSLEFPCLGLIVHYVETKESNPAFHYHKLPLSINVHRSRGVL